MERVTFHNDDSLILRAVEHANRESRSSRFLISLVEAGVAK
jgi:hypothetical protein